MLQIISINNWNSKSNKTQAKTPAESPPKKKKKNRQPIDSQRLAQILGGAGGSRTLVQTGKPYAFYTLIPDFGFRAAARPGPPTTALSSEFHADGEARRRYFRFICTA